MAINKSISIKQSVGHGGINQSKDVQAVQTQLNTRMPPVLTKLVVDGKSGSITIAAIRNFQKLIVGIRQPDGRVDPSGKTLTALNNPASKSKWARGVEISKWGGNSARWSQGKKFQSLNPSFRIKVKGVVNALKRRGFQPKIFFGWRSVAVQKELVRKGRSKVRFSFHNAQKPDGTPNAYAADIIDKRWGWGSDAKSNGFWNALGQEAKKRGLIWGGATGLVSRMWHIFRGGKTSSWEQSSVRAAYEIGTSYTTIAGYYHIGHSSRPSKRPTEDAMVVNCGN